MISIVGMNCDLCSICGKQLEHLVTPPRIGTYSLSGLRSSVLIGVSTGTIVVRERNRRLRCRRALTTPRTGLRVLTPRTHDA